MEERSVGGRVAHQAATPIDVPCIIVGRPSQLASNLITVDGLTCPFRFDRQPILFYIVQNAVLRNPEPAQGVPMSVASASAIST
jgi:hypothetical protein